MVEKRYVDITGNRYNRLTVVGYSHTAQNGKTYWKCKCDCGNEVILRKDVFMNLGNSNQTLSCGCLKKEYQQFFRETMSKTMKKWKRKRKV